MQDIEHDLEPESFYRTRTEMYDRAEDMDVLELADELAGYIECDKHRTTEGAAALGLAEQLRDRLRADETTD